MLRCFSGSLQVLGEQGLIDGKRIGTDATTLDANAALRCGRLFFATPGRMWRL